MEFAARSTVRGKRRRPDVAWFLFNLDRELARLHELLSARRYCPAPTELVTIRDPKPRVISRVPIADRVVHTALVTLMEPIFLRSLRPESFACRSGFGTHRALLRLLELMRHYPYALHLDIRSYFPSIDCDTLLYLLRRRIRDVHFMDIVERIVRSTGGLYDRPEVRRAARLGKDWPPTGRGLPIGSYLSQLFAAHVYLSGFDHFVKRQIKVPGYLRYVDDIFCFGRSRSQLERWRGEIGGWLSSERGLRLKHPRARVLSCRGTLDALGYRLSRSGWRPRPRAYGRLKKRIAAEFSGGADADLERSMASFVGVLLF